MAAPISAALRAQAAALRLQADALDALASAAEASEPDALLGVDDCRALGVGREALKGAVRRQELTVSLGPRGKLLVRKSALEAWLASRPYAPTARAVPEAQPDREAWERTVRQAS
jgi:hypothetical protein